MLHQDAPAPHFPWGLAHGIRLPTAVVQRRRPHGLAVTISVGGMDIPLAPEAREALVRVAVTGEAEHVRDEDGRTWAVDPVPGSPGVIITCGSDRVAVRLSSVLDAD